MLGTRIIIWEKLGGVVTMLVAAAGLALINIIDPPIFVKIISAFVGALVWLIGIVFLFAEGSIIEERLGKKAPQAEETMKEAA
jgi:uncharacterized protein YacL